MAEYIEREEVMKTARDGYHSDFGRSAADLTSLREVLEDTPTADVVEVRYGKWIKKPHVSKEYKQCNVCKYDFSRLIPDNYCPNCGARMDGDKE